ncbi:MAG: DUF5107 domain-containing protein [Armatimonadota bacterium]
MSELRLDRLTMPAAELGPENPLPPLATRRDVHASLETDPDVPAEDRRYIGYGHPGSCLPYLMQDGYRRELRPRAFATAVLENELLRATFLLDLGGRLWSLVHKPSGRELLEMNPVFQPANLAIRNAWFSGGVEWNIGVIGHCTLTCSPLFAARVAGPGGTPVLRLYEWERIRRVPFQVDAYLPEGSPVLFVRVRIQNPHDDAVPMYWWSNMAVPETPETRVVVPADHAYQFGYGGRMRRVAIPFLEGEDVTYTTRLKRSMDFFYRIRDGHRPWIAALDGEGLGLVQTSTSLLKGRKLFAWGTGPGGQRWQEFLSRPGRAYLEIQAGLARTQVEHLPMPAGAEWSWLEAYGLMEADPKAVHGADWQEAGHVVEERLEALIPRERLDAEFRSGARMARQAPAEVLHRGSGWGALERLRRETTGEPPFCGDELVFDDASLQEAQAPWRRLLCDGELPEPAADAAPRSMMVQDEWREMLEAAVAAGRGTHWLSWLHLGVMRRYAGQKEAARGAWEKSLSLCQTAWALRNLAVLAQEEGDDQRAADLLVSAVRARPGLLPLAVECGRALIKAGRPGEWLALMDELPESLRNVPRIRLLEGQAALSAGEVDTVKRILDEAPEVDDLREGERSLSDLWFGFHEQRLSAERNVPVDDALREYVRREFPPPEAIDFRMAT